MRFILLLHRYLAVAVGLLMVLWCLSGFVMMYQSYPDLSPSQRLDGLAPLDFSSCCTTVLSAADDSAGLPGFRIEMLLGDPVLRLNTGVAPGNSGGSGISLMNLRTGESVAELSPQQILAVARQYAAGNAIAGLPHSRGVIDVDQWTIQSARRNRPVHHIAFNDPAATEIYISGSSGEVFQTTNRRVRLLSWLGAIPHWLYPAVLRQNGALWTSIVIWTSVAGSFLAATGLYVGLARLRRNRDGQLASPFRGWWYWHHISGLLFGVLALTWVFSGLMTMNPWGVLSGERGDDYRGQITGSATWGELKQFVTALNTLEQAHDYKQLQSAPFDHKLYVLAAHSGIEPRRLDANATQTTLSAADVSSVLSRLSVPVQDYQQLNAEDSYYYGHKREVSLPVHRVILDDAQQTRLYIDRHSGSVRTLTSAGRVSRWISSGLHGLDFPVLRMRPFWDIVVIVLLAGVTALCAIGSWLAIKRVRMDLRIYRARLRRRLGRNTGVPEKLMPNQEIGRP